MTGAGCSAHPEPGGHSELLATRGEVIYDPMPKQGFHLSLQWPLQVAQQLCCEHCSPVQDRSTGGCTSSMALIEPPHGG